MCIKTWAIAGLIGAFGLAASAAQDVAQLLHRQTRELMEAVGAGARPVWDATWMLLCFTETRAAPCCGGQKCSRT